MSQYRLEAITVIKRIVAYYKLTVETRDLSVQLYDRICSSSLPDSEENMKLCTVAVVVISSKLLDVKKLRMVNAPIAILEFTLST